MAQCKRCGTEFSSFSLRGFKDICPDCEKQMAPYRAQAAAIPAREPETPVVTLVLVLLNVAYFVAMVVNGVSPTEPQGLQLLRWGSEFGPLTLGTDPWRLATCMFIHIGFIHLLVNMWSLWVLGNVAERLFGRPAYLLLYLASGVFGSYLSLAWNPLRMSAGASGAIFGIAGALLAGFKFGSLGLHPQIVKQTLRSLVLVIGYNLAFGLFGNLNNMAHLGGLIGGFAIGFAFTRVFPSRSERYEKAFLPILAVVVVVLLLGYFGLRKAKASQLGVGQAELALEHDDCSVATPLLEESVRNRPNEPDAHRELGYCYEQAKRDADAEREFRRAVELAPNDAYAWERLGWLAFDTDPARAAEAFRSALRADPKSAEAHEGLGVSLAKTGHAEEGLKEIQQAQSLSPDDPKVLHALVFAYQKLGRHADEIKPLTRLAELAPDDPEAHTELADAYEKIGDAKSAARERQTAERLAAKKSANKTR